MKHTLYRLYNLPVYLHYNGTFRRAYLAMLRCKTGSGAVESVANTGPAIVSQNPRHATEQPTGTCRQENSHGRGRQGNDERQPPAGHDHRPTGVLWTNHRHTATDQTQARNSRATTLQRY